MDWLILVVVIHFYFLFFTGSEKVISSKQLKAKQNNPKDKETRSPFPNRWAQTIKIDRISRVVLRKLVFSTPFRGVELHKLLSFP